MIKRVTAAATAIHGEFFSPPDALEWVPSLAAESSSRIILVAAPSGLPEQ